MNSKELLIYIRYSGQDVTCVMADMSTGVRGPVWSQAHLLTPSGRTNPIGQPCSAFVPLLETFLPDPDLCYLVLPENLILPDPDLCRGRKIGPTGTSGQPFGPGVVLFWAAAGAIVSFRESLADPSYCVHWSSCRKCLMWSGQGLDAERGGSDVGSRFIPSAEPSRELRPAPRFLHVSPLWSAHQPVHDGFLKSRRLTLELGTEWSWIPPWIVSDSEELHSSHRVTTPQSWPLGWGYLLRNMVGPGTRFSCRRVQECFPYRELSALVPFNFALASKENSRMCFWRFTAA